jgi:hypothetical protein
MSLDLVLELMSQSAFITENGKVSAYGGHYILAWMK